MLRPNLCYMTLWCIGFHIGPQIEEEWVRAPLGSKFVLHPICLILYPYYIISRSHTFIRKDLHELFFNTLCIYNSCQNCLNGLSPKTYAWWHGIFQLYMPRHRKIASSIVPTVIMSGGLWSFLIQLQK